jgi:DNA-binding NarL/FixJ family response regulator
VGFQKSAADLDLCFYAARSGMSNRKIGAELFISPKTASVHVSNILAKLAVTNRTEAAVIAQREGS